MQHCYNLCRIGWLHINGQTPGRFAQLASFFGPEPAVPHQQLDHHHAAAAAAAPAAEMREELIKCKSASPWTCVGFSWCGPLECQLHCCVANRFNFAARAYTTAERCSHSIISTVIHPTASSRQSSNHDWHAAQLCRNHQARVGSAVATAAREQGREIEFCSFQRLPTTGTWSIKLHQSVIRGM